MIRPWQVMAEIMDLTTQVGWQDFETRLFEILERDDPKGVWVSGELNDKEALEDKLGMYWRDIRDIYESHIDEHIHATVREEAEEAGLFEAVKFFFGIDDTDLAEEIRNYSARQKKKC